jgi:protein-S-isoprenylcysteine O-methyltransferase Ste14
VNNPWSLFEWAFVVEYFVLFAVRFPFARRQRAMKPLIQRLDRVDRVLLGLTLVGFVATPWLYLVTPLLDFADYQSPAGVGWTGIAVAIACVWLFWRSHVDLGRQWSASLEIFEGHAIVSHGVYHSIRHPMYAAIWLWAVSQALLLPNWIAGPSALVAFTSLYFVRVPREERMMLEHFGQPYAAYMAHTGRVVPGIGRIRSRDDRPS